MRASSRLARLTLTLPATLLVATATEAQTASISGVVYDSIARQPLADAAVFLWDTPHRAETDAEGRYHIEDVPAGEYNLLFFHTRLGELGVSAGPRSVSLAPGETADVHLATPSLGTVVQSQCLMEDRPDGAASIAGNVLDGESEVPLSGAYVSLTWTEDGTSEIRSIDMNAASDGTYRSCALPAGVPVLLTAQYYGRQNTRREIVLPQGGFQRADLQLYDQAASRITATLRDATSGQPVEGAEAWLRGTAQRVLSDGGGHFVLEEVPPGTYMLMTDHLAYGTKMDTLIVPPGLRLEVEMRLDTRPIEIAPLTVTAEAAPVVIDRRRGGIIITREQIESVRQRSRDASDVIRSLHVPGVIVRHQSNGVICVGYSTGQVKMNQTGCVEMMIYINDVRATDADLALRMPPDAIERMVIYKPVQAGNLFGLGGGNGVWAIYTRGN
jgi:hypothetical protein